MTTGSPPPWLINMQRYGPPPSYPNLRIPGLNAPIPAGAMFGYQPGGWGKPPVDEYGRPLYGDVFGASGDSSAEAQYVEVEVDKHSRWGQLTVLELEDDDEEDDDDGADDEGEGQGEDMSGMETPSISAEGIR